MAYFYSSPVSNIPLQPEPQPRPSVHFSAVRMTRAGSNSSTMSTSSTSSAISISSSCNSRGRADSTSTGFLSCWSSPSSYISDMDMAHGKSRHTSNPTSYLPTPYRSSLQHSSTSSCPAADRGSPSSFFSDDELLSPSLQSTHMDPSLLPPNAMTTEEQVVAVRAQAEREKQMMDKAESWWKVDHRAVANQKRNRVVRFAGEGNKPSSTSSSSAKRRSGAASRRVSNKP